MTAILSLDEAAAAFRASLLGRDAAALRRLMSAYQPVYTGIQAEVAVLTQQIAEAREAGEIIRPSWLRERQRLTRLREQVIAEWSRYSDSAEGIITTLQQEAIDAALDEAYQLTLAALDDDPLLAMGADVTRLRPDAVEDLVGSLSDGSPLRELLDDLGTQAAKTVEDTLLHAVATGRSPRKTARDLRTALGGDMTRALRIARTEHLRAYRTTALRSYQANEDLLRGWQWRASPQRRTCPVCLAMDGQEFGLDVPFASHPNCFPAGTMIQTPPVVASTARWYEGEIVEIETVGGNLLTVTPNHSILTPEGWVAAGLLHEGSDVISARDAQAILRTINPDNDHIPTAIEQIAETLRGALGVASGTVPSTPEHFHGDGEGSEVNIVYTNRLLGNALDAAIFQPFFEEQFVRRDVGLSRLSRLGAFSLLFDRVFTSTRRSVRSLSVALMLVRCSCLRQQSVGFDLCSDWNPRQLQAAANNITRNAKSISQALLRLTSLVAPDDLSIGESRLCSYCGTAFRGRNGVSSLFVPPDTTRDQEPAQSLPGDAVFAGQILTAFASHIITDRVLKFSIRRFAGHIYNLETTEGWYIANNIVTHNCRCTPIPLLRSRPAPERETGAAWFARQDADVQREMLGAGGYDLYQQGKLSLTDLVGERTDPRWGPQRYRRSLAEIQKGASSRDTARRQRAIATAPGMHATLDDAKAWAEHHYSHIEWDFDGAHIDAINPTLRQFHKLAQEWPDVVKDLRYVGTYQGTTTPGRAMVWGKEWAHAGYPGVSTGTFLGLNPKYYGDVSLYQDGLSRGVALAFHPAGCDTIESVLTHEFGHLVDYYARSQREAFRDVVSTDGFGIISDTVSLWKQANKATKKLSEYALTNDAEGWAEGFAAIHHSPRKSWSIFVKRLDAFLRVIDPTKTPRRSSFRWYRDIPIDERASLRDEMDQQRIAIGLIK